jgi:hypothetical protein
VFNFYYLYRFGDNCSSSCIFSNYNFYFTYIFFLFVHIIQSTLAWEDRSERIDRNIVYNIYLYIHYIYKVSIAVSCCSYYIDVSCDVYYYVSISSTGDRINVIRLYINCITVSELGSVAVGRHSWILPKWKKKNECPTPPPLRYLETITFLNISTISLKYYLLSKVYRMGCDAYDFQWWHL